MPDKDKPVKVKATHKIKRKSYGGFYSEFSRYDTRGKTFKELMLMIEDLKANVRFQMFRIRNIKYSNLKRVEEIKINRETVRQRSYSRARGRLKFKNEVKELRLQVKEQDKVIKSLNRKITSRDLQLSIKRDAEIIKVPIIQKEIKIIEKEAKPFSSPIMRNLKKPFVGRVHNTLELLLKTKVFLNETPNLTHNQLTLLTQAEAFEGFTSAELTEGLKRYVPQMLKVGYIHKERLDGKTTMYHLTPYGYEIVKKYKDHLSYSKNPIL